MFNDSQPVTINYPSVMFSTTSKIIVLIQKTEKKTFLKYVLEFNDAYGEN